MTAPRSGVTTTPPDEYTGHRTDNYPTRRPSTETKASFKTTEFWIYLLAVGGVLLASFLVDSGDSGRGDVFRADKAWLYIVILTIGYLASRGLAKSGSRDNYDDR